MNDWLLKEDTRASKKVLRGYFDTSQKETFEKDEKDNMWFDVHTCK